jgi:energy-coupling factor transport system permease protein
MQDVRIRIAAASLLSVVAFVSLQGAIAALFWWLLFCRRVLNGRHIRQVSFLIVLIAFFSVVIEFTGGDGISYFVRMTILVLIGLWLYNEYRPGDFPDLCVWLFGDKAGFELGMIAEMGMQWVESLVIDFERLQVAQKLKRIRWGLGSIVPAGRVLIHGSLARAGDTAELLAARGYCNGGTRCPVFRTGFMDLVAGTAVILVVIAAFVPVSEFFILYR